VSGLPRDAAACTRIFHGSERPRPAFRRRFVRRARVRARVIDFLIEPSSPLAADASLPWREGGEGRGWGGGREEKKGKATSFTWNLEMSRERDDRVGPNESSRARARALRALDLFSLLPARKVSGDITRRELGSELLAYVRNSHSRARGRQLEFQR